MGILYGVGIGPGDPELITLKALNVLKTCDVIFLPSNRGYSLAEAVIEDYLGDAKRVYLEFPMGEDNNRAYKNAAMEIFHILSGDKKGAFVTLGDPMCYSTFIYLFEEIKALGVEVSIIPGVPSFSAVFSLLKIPFARKGQSVLVTDKWFNADEFINSDRVLLLKGSVNKEAILALKKMGYKVYYARRIFMEGEAIYTREDDMINDADYFSMIIGVRG